MENYIISKENYSISERIKNDFNLIIENIPEFILQKIESDSISWCNSIKQTYAYCDNSTQFDDTELASIIERKDLLESDLKQSNELVEKLKNEIKDLNCQFESFELQISKLTREKENNSLEKSTFKSYEYIEDKDIILKNEKGKRSEEKDIYTNNIQLLEETLKEKNVEIKEKLVEITHLEHKFDDELSKECEELKNKLKLMELKFSENDSTIENRDEEIIQLRQKIKSKTGEIERLTSKMKNDIKSHKKKLEKMTKEINEKEQLHENIEDENKKLNKELKKIKMSTITKEESDNYLDEIKELKKICSQRVKEKEKLSAECEELRQYLENKNKEIIQIKQKNTNKNEELENKLKESENNYQKTKESLMKTQNDMKELEENLKNIDKTKSREFKALQFEKENLTGEINQMHIKIENYKSHLEKLESVVKSKDEIISKQKEEMSELRRNRLNERNLEQYRGESSIPIFWRKHTE